MFYSLDLLSAHRGKFGIIWLAATRVRKNLTRRELNSVDIVAACTEITSCILGKVRIRFSLYLASQLTFGLCIIYREKTKIVLRDLQELYARSAVVFQSCTVDLPATCPKPRSKKRKRDEIVIPDPPEIPMADLFGGTADFGDMQIPDLLSFPTLIPDVDFLDTQNSLYQARVEDITMLEDNLNLASAQNLTFGEDFAPSALEILQEHSVLPLDKSVPEFNQPGCSNAPPSAEACLVSIEPVPEAVEPPSKRPRIEETEPIESVTPLPDPSPIEVQQPGVVESELCQAAEQNVIVSQLPPETVANVPVVNQVLPEPYTVPLEELNQSLSGHRDSVRRIRRAVRSKLIVDDVLRLTVDQLRYNMNHGEETMVLSSSRLAEPTSRLQTRYLLSNNVPRLLAVPANLETALSAHLSELWCRFRRMGEEFAHQEEPELDVVRETDSNISRPHGSTMRIAEESMETSIEQPRAGHATSSLLRSVSLLGSTSDVVMDLTVNQAANMTDSVTSVLPAESGSHPLSRVPDDYSVRADTVSAAPNPLETMPFQVEKTTPRPLLDKMEENRVINQETLSDIAIAKTKPENFRTSDDVWSAIQVHLSAAPDGVCLDRICPLGSTRRVAALTFATVLQLLKELRVLAIQSEPFGPIRIRLAT